jgi:hypothetical protein
MRAEKRKTNKAKCREHTHTHTLSTLFAEKKKHTIKRARQAASIHVFANQLAPRLHEVLLVVLRGEGEGGVICVRCHNRGGRTFNHTLQQDTSAQTHTYTQTKRKREERERERKRKKEKKYLGK